MKRKVEIIPEKSEVIQLTKTDLIEKLEVDPIGTLSSYDLDDDTILELVDFIPVDTLLMCCDPSERLVKNLLSIDYLTDEKLSNLSLTSISKFSPEFLESKITFINFDRVLLNYSTSDDDFFLKNDPTPFIEKSNLHGNYFWRILSSNKLPKKTILENLDSFDWFLLTINNNFSDFTEEEYALIIPYLTKLEESKNIEAVTPEVDPHQDIDELINKVLQKYNQ